MERGGLRQIRPAPSKLAELPKVSSGGVPVYMAPRLSSMPMYQRLTPVGTSGVRAHNFLCCWLSDPPPLEQHHIDVPQDISDADDVSHTMC